jgi:hypothetical protein
MPEQYLRAVTLRLDPQALYHCPDHPGTPVRVVGVATHDTTGQEQVVYRLGGQLRFCTLTSWAGRFERAAPEPVPERPAGYISTEGSQL